MSDSKTYEDFVQEAGEVKRDLDVVYSPTMGSLKKAFSIIFDGTDMTATDFKRFVDMQFYQGGRPSPDSPPKESTLVMQIANLIKLELLCGRGKFVEFLNAQGIHFELMGTGEVSDTFLVGDDDSKKLKSAWQGAGIDEDIPYDRSEALTLLLNRALNLQQEIVEMKEALKEVSENVEEAFKIKKANFLKAASLHALLLKKGHGAMGEKLDATVDGAENLISAVEPLIKSK